MASEILGRTKCPECSEPNAHVKKSEKCIYRFCPECQSIHHAKTERQRRDLMEKTRLDKPLGEPRPTPTVEGEPTPTTTPTPTPTTTTPRKHGLGLFK